MPPPSSSSRRQQCEVHTRNTQSRLHHQSQKQKQPRHLPHLHLLRLIQLVALLCLCLAAPTTLGCPADVCICKWKGGKQTVECGAQQLPSLPEGMDPGTQVLNFSGNSLQVLQSERFLRMDLLNLQKIFLARNQLIRIHEKAFRGLTNLVELDLSDNALQHVPSETFQDYTSLMRLSLSGNPIRELKSAAFRHLSFLTTLELSNCQVERIENEAFVGMDNLEWLRLDGNRIGFIQGGHILPKSLHGISLQSNRWMCDCRLVDMHAWLVNYNTPQLEEPRCVEPARLKGQSIKSLKKDELACLPEVLPQSTYTEISEGRNISIQCVVRAIPAPRVLWLFNGQVMSNDSLLDNLHMYYYIDEGVAASTSSAVSEEKRSEIFIYNVGPEDNGTFSCVGQNVAGTTFSNYTLRVIIKEPPVVNEVSFPRDYMRYIVASSSGAAIIVVLLLCTVACKCRARQQRKACKRKQCMSSGGVGGNESQSGGGNNVGTSGGINNVNGCLSDANNMHEQKCASLLNDGGGDNSLHGVSSAMLLSADGLTPTKLAKENGLLLAGQMQQNMLLYAPAHFQQQPSAAAHLHDGVERQSHMQLSESNGSTPPPSLLLSGAYCSPPAALRSFQEKNPDLVNDAESGVKHKLQSGGGTNGENDCYETSSDCVTLTPATYDNCYQLQFGAQMLRAGNGMNNANAAAASRFAAMTTLPRGMQLKTLMHNMQTPTSASNIGSAAQHQVDVHLNPVCFLGQDGYAYDYLQQQPPPPSAHHHLHLQQQHSLGSQTQLQQHHQQQQQQQQQFYRTLPHNRAHKQQQFAASAAANAALRYSMEAEFLQRSTTPSYLPDAMRFNAAGYPLQYPSPPEGYKSNGATPPPPALAQPQTHATGDMVGAFGNAAFQQWPPCLPGYHAQPIRYPPTIVGVLSSNNNSQNGNNSNNVAAVGTQSAQATAQPLTSCHTQTANNKSNSNSSIISNISSSSHGNSNSNNTATTATEATSATIPECDESDMSPCATAASNSNSAATQTTATASSATSTAAKATTANGAVPAETTKLRHLSGPLADSPDEGYVGDSQEGSDI